MHPANDGGVGLRCLQQGVAGGSILPWRFGQLIVFALTEKVDLGVNVLLPSCDLGLGQHGIVWLIVVG